MNFGLFKNKIFIFSIVLVITIGSLISYTFLFKPNNKIITTDSNNSFKICKLQLGGDLISTKYKNIIKNKNLGVLTNQTGVNSDGKHILDVLTENKDNNVVAIFSPKQNLNKKNNNELTYESNHPKYNIPLYNIDNKNINLAENVMNNIDTFIVDIQDIGVRYHANVSTLYYFMETAKKYNKEIIVLDRPNPLGGSLVEGPVLEDSFKSFLGVDNLPIIHGMTIGELSNFFNRNIDCNLQVIKMEGYNRDMQWIDTDLEWINHSDIPSIISCFSYASTGLTDKISNIEMEDYFTWFGSNNLDTKKLSNILEDSNIPGVSFACENKGEKNGIKIIVNDYNTYNPLITGFYILASINSIIDLNLSKNNDKLNEFNKLMGNDKISKMLADKRSAEDIINSYSKELDNFKKEREKYLLYQ